MEFMKNHRRSQILLGPAECSVVQRVVAKTIDFIIVAIIFLLGKALWLPLGWLGALVYAAIQDSLGQGQSVGKKIIGLQVLEDYSGLPCSPSHSILRNIPWVISLFCLPIPVVGVLMQLVLVPLICLELYLLVTLDSGVRLGDVMGNTVVVEYFEEPDDMLHQ
ncbi:MAG: RDD family protein [Deltaproteobacteria bacterium]